jgi:hypothetical protein
MNERLPLASVAVVACAALASEVLLTRFFAIVHWHHFAYMMISLALLGFGASGTLLALMRHWVIERSALVYIANLFLFGLCLILAPLAAQVIPFRAEELLWNPWQPLWLVAIYLVLATPFFCAANAIGLALMLFQRRAGRVYAADLIGAGAGGILIVVALYLVTPHAALKLLAGGGFVAAVIAWLELRARDFRWLAAGIAGLSIAVAIPAAWLKPEPGPYKSLSQALRVNDARVVAERSSPMGRVSVIESPRVPLRHAPGLSLMSTSEPPPQLGVFTDGDNMDAITAATDEAHPPGFLAESTSALAYRLARPQSALILAAGGGIEILRARQLGANRIEALELNSQIVRLLTSDFRDFSGRLARQPGVELRIGEPRGFLAANSSRYDLIQMSLASSAGGGLSGLTEDYLHTVEALQLYYRHLAPGGYLSMTRYVQVPPRDGIKLLATAIAALRASGVDDPGSRLLMIRGWQTATLLIKSGAASPDDIERMRAFCDQYAFDVVWFPGMRREQANLFNQLPEPYFFDAALALLGPEGGSFIASYPFDIRPATDDRPYFQNFFRWQSFTEAWRAKGRGGMALLEAGYAVLAATLVQALLAGVLLIVAPLAILKRQSLAPGARWRVVAYFGSIGLSFLFIEIVFLQKLLLFVQQPTLALALVLATFLIGAGTGSAWASRGAAATQSRRRLMGAIVAVIILGALYAVIFDSLLALLGGWSLIARAAVAVLLLAPLAFFMGMPFPLALRELEQPLVPWAWGINGCASVVSPVLATLLAIDLGFTVVLWLALVLYAVVPAAFPRASRSSCHRH